MKVDFNNVRVQAGKAFNELMEKLEELPENEKEYLQNDIDELRMALACIIYSFSEGDEEFADVGDKIKLKFFNEKPEND
jgi:hypothetical protein